MHPFFSIVIPTRDRPHLLRYALLSALTQDYDDFEVLVSDNSTNEKTKEVIEEIKKETPSKIIKKLRYVKTPRPLDMCSSWEFALQNAKGLWMAFLSDDDILTYAFLKESHKVMQQYDGFDIYSMLHTVYFQDEQKLIIRKRETSAEVISSKENFRFSFERIISGFPLPKPHFSLISKRFYDFMKHRFGNIFLPIAPDVSSAYIMLYYTENFVRINAPLTIFCRSQESYGVGSLYHEEKLREYLNQFENGIEALYSPIMFPTVHNLIFETQMITLKKISEVEHKKVSDIINEIGISMRDTIRRVFVLVEEDLNRLYEASKMHKFKMKLIELKIRFWLWKIKELSKGIILLDRSYITDIIQSRMKKMIRTEDRKDTNEALNEFIVHTGIKSIQEAKEFIESNYLKNGQYK